jgi:hypothetical protein
MLIINARCLQSLKQINVVALKNAEFLIKYGIMCHLFGADDRSISTDQARTCSISGGELYIRTVSMPEIHWGDTRFTECCWCFAKRTPNSRKRAAGFGAHREVRFFSSIGLSAGA